MELTWNKYSNPKKMIAESMDKFKTLVETKFPGRFLEKLPEIVKLKSRIFAALAMNHESRIMSHF